MESKISGLEQGRAKFAYECAKEGSLLDKKKEYRSYTKKIPMLIKTNGLGATFAFMFSKGGTYSLIGKHILDWLKKDEKGLLPSDLSINSFEKLNDYIISEDSSKYRMITVEVLAFFNWLRRFAEGLIGDPDDSKEGDLSES
jgi:CRISPR-associated protein Cmr5